MKSDDTGHRQHMRSLLSRHDYAHRKPDPDNCGACALTSGDEEGPNYAGWARVYVGAGITIPAKWFDAFNRELKSDNQAYAKALADDVSKYGVTFK